jgi:hypothetical protein
MANSSNNARYQLLGQPGARGHGLGDAGTSGWGDSDDEPEYTRDMSVPQIKQQQYQVLEGTFSKNPFYKFPIA